MKRTSTKILILAVIMCLILAGLAAVVCFVSFDVGDASVQVIDENSEVITSDEFTPEPIPTPTPVPTSAICFIGDSRTVGIENAVSDECDSVFYGKVSAGEAWLAEAAEKLKDETGVKYCVIWLGVNDLANTESYLEEYAKLPDLFPEIQFIFASVGPVSDGASVSNEEIEQFNLSLSSKLSDDYWQFDVYNYLAAIGFCTTDGLHYDNETSVAVYDYIYQGISVIAN